MANIAINGLTGYQVKMLDHIWSLKSQEEYSEWYDLLDEEDQTQADLLVRMIILASIDQLVPESERIFSDANRALKKFMVH